MANKLWFKNKVYGYGWTPATKEGWLAILVFIIILCLTGLFAGVVTSNEASFVILFCILASFETFFLTILAFKKGEKPRWSWGKKIK